MQTDSTRFGTLKPDTNESRNMSAAVSKTKWKIQTWGEWGSVAIYGSQDGVHWHHWAWTRCAAGERCYCWVAYRRGCSAPQTSSQRSHLDWITSSKENKNCQTVCIERKSAQKAYHLNRSLSRNVISFRTEVDMSLFVKLRAINKVTQLITRWERTRYGEDIFSPLSESWKA